MKKSDEPRRPRADWYDDSPLIPSLQVEMSEPQESGLLDAEGRKLFKQAEPIGFIARKQKL